MKYLRNVTTIMLEKGRCVGCGMCITVCPRGVFRRDGRAVDIVDKDTCIECGACAKNCAYDAISVDAGVGCATAMIDGIIRFGNPDKGTCDCSNSSGCC